MHTHKKKMCIIEIINFNVYCSVLMSMYNDNNGDNNCYNNEDKYK